MCVRVSVCVFRIISHAAATFCLAARERKKERGEAGVSWAAGGRVNVAGSGNWQQKVH